MIVKSVFFALIAISSVGICNGVEAKEPVVTAEKSISPNADVISVSSAMRLILSDQIAEG